MLLNCGVGEDSWESLGQQGDPTSQSQRKSVLNIHWRTDAEAETLILWSPDEKNWLIRKDPDAGKDWRQEEKGTTEDEMVGWHHRLNGHDFEQACELVMDREAWHATVHGVVDWVTELNWTEVCHSFSSNEQASFNFVTAVTICNDFGAPQNKACHCFHCFPIYLPLSDGAGCHDLSFLNVEF